MPSRVAARGVASLVQRVSRATGDGSRSRKRRARAAAAAKCARKENSSPNNADPAPTAKKPKKKRKATSISMSERKRAVMNSVDAPFACVKSPQRFKTPSTGVKASTTTSTSKRKWRVDKAMLTSHLSQELGKQVRSMRDVTLEELDAVLSKKFSMREWIRQRPCPEVRRLNMTTKDRDDVPASFVDDLRMKHKGKEVGTCLDAVLAFLGGSNYNKHGNPLMMKGERFLSRSVCHDVVGERLNEFTSRLWKLTQRLVIIVAGNLHLDHHMWNGVSPLPLMVMYDCRWQKSRGWNSLDATGCGAELLTRLPTSVVCLHRATPTKADGDRKNTDKSAKGCDAVAAARTVSEPTPLGVDVSHLMKDGDASSLPEAMQSKEEAMKAVDNADECNPRIESLLCARHHGKNCSKKSCNEWRRNWDVPKSKIGNHVRGSANNMIKNDLGDGAATHEKMKAIPMHIAGDHSACPENHGCRSDDPEVKKMYKQTVETKLEHVANKMADVVNHHYSREKCDKLRFNVTTNVIESMNGELMTMYPKREFSRDGKRCDNYSILVAVRRVHGYEADLLLLELMGFNITSSMEKARDTLNEEFVRNKECELSRKQRRKEIRKLRSGWDKAATSKDVEEGRTYKHEPKKGRNKKKTNATRSRGNGATQSSRSVVDARNAESSCEEEGDVASDSDECASDGSFCAAADETTTVDGLQMSAADVRRLMRLQAAEIAREARAARAKQRA